MSFTCNVILPFRYPKMKNKKRIWIPLIFMACSYNLIGQVGTVAKRNSYRISVYSAKEAGVHHLLQLENDTAFSLSIYPKNWLSCWQINDYKGTYTLEKDTLRFIYLVSRMNREAEMVQETFVVRRNKNIYRINDGKLFFAKYRFGRRRFRIIETW